MSMFDVKEFNDKFGIPCSRKPNFLSQEDMKYRLNFLLEEMNELAQNSGFAILVNEKDGTLSYEPIPEWHDSANLEECLDGLIDLVYVAYGTALMMGFGALIPRGIDSRRSTIWGEAWSRVHLANMSKQRATSVAASKRGHSFDVIKPKGWIKPTFGDLLK